MNYCSRCAARLERDLHRATREIVVSSVRTEVFQSAPESGVWTLRISLGDVVNSFAVIRDMLAIMSAYLAQHDWEVRTAGPARVMDSCTREVEFAAAITIDSAQASHDAT